MPILPLQVLTLIADIAIFAFVIYYFLKFHAKEKELEQKEGKADTEYHQVLNTALAKERKILDDATNEASKVISEAHFENTQMQQAVNQALQKIVTDVQAMSQTSQQGVQAALQKAVADIQKDTALFTQNYSASFQASLAKLAQQSATEFQNTTNTMHGDLQKALQDFQVITKGLEMNLDHQIKDFHASLLPKLEKELETYKQSRMVEVEQMITHIIQTATQEVLNKTISMEDHKKLIIDALEKAKREGTFN